MDFNSLFARSFYFQHMRRHVHCSSFTSVTEVLPQLRQVAALCFRHGLFGKEVLLITSRGSKQWITPKGWPIKRKQDHEAAFQEAWEEAGVRTARVTTQPIGSYQSVKQLKNQSYAGITTDVFLTEVFSVADSFPEANQRSRAWLTPQEAATRIRERQLQRLFLHLERISEAKTPTHDCFLSM